MGLIPNNHIKKTNFVKEFCLDLIWYCLAVSQHPDEKWWEIDELRVLNFLGKTNRQAKQSLRDLQCLTIWRISWHKKNISSVYATFFVSIQNNLETVYTYYTRVRAKSFPVFSCFITMIVWNQVQYISRSRTEDTAHTA